MANTFWPRSIPRRSPVQPEPLRLGSPSRLELRGGRCGFHYRESAGPPLPLRSAEEEGAVAAAEVSAAAVAVAVAVAASSAKHPPGAERPPRWPHH